jgi:predicted DNA-binding ribbon-helix-helix protein
MVTNDTIWTANIKDRRNGELTMLINRLADEYQQIHENNNNETTTADVYNEQYLKEIGDSDEEED